MPHVGSVFARQAAAAGLSGAQTMALQTRVDAYIGETGGKQTAANKIEYGDGSVLLLALPTEAVGRDLAAAPPTEDTKTCPYYYACLWSKTNYTGDFYTLYYCNSWKYIPWVSDGSFKNNQTSGTKLGMKYVNGLTEWWAPAYYSSSVVYWRNITYVTAC